MKKQTMPTGFSGFAWGLAAFCLPILLWPMASLLSTAFVKKPYTERLSDRSFLDYLLGLSLCFSLNCAFTL